MPPPAAHAPVACAGDTPHVDPRSGGGQGSLHPDAAGGGDSSAGSGGSGSQPSHSHGGLIAALTTVGVLAALAAAAFLMRERIYEHVPQAERAVASLRDRLVRWCSPRVAGYGLGLGLDPADTLEMSPPEGFTAMQPPPGLGSYAPLPPEHTQYVGYGPPRVG